MLLFLAGIQQPVRSAGASWPRSTELYLSSELKPAGTSEAPSQQGRIKLSWDPRLGYFNEAPMILGPLWVLGTPLSLGTPGISPVWPCVDLPVLHKLTECLFRYLHVSALLATPCDCTVLRKKNRKKKRSGCHIPALFVLKLMHYALLPARQLFHLELPHFAPALGSLRCFCLRPGWTKCSAAFDDLIWSCCCRLLEQSYFSLWFNALFPCSLWYKTHLTDLVWLVCW